MRLLICLFILTLWSCTAREKSSLPNIVWIVAEDLGPYVPSFGDSTVQTPNLSRLAAEGICYDNVYSPSPVCAPSRAALATGMYPTHIGANHMRTGPWYSDQVSQEVIRQYAQYMPKGIQPYEPILPDHAKMMSEYMRMAGYYCTNNSKEDYQFRKSPFGWDESSNKAHWKNRKNNQPFFSVFNLNVTHESQIWARANDSLWVDQKLKVPGFPYLPRTDTALMDIRRMYSNIVMMDQQVGKLLEQLEAQNLLEETIVFWYTDHGGPLPRQKRLLYDSGLNVPMIIRFPNRENAGERDDRMISFIDFAPTVLSMAGIKPPEHMDGKAFLGTYQRTEEPDFIFAAADRFDESYDTNRAVRDKRYKYIRYYEPEKPMFLHVNYRDQMPIMRELYKLKERNELTPQQALWFRDTKPEEEFFDTQDDPHEVNNLVNDPEHQWHVNRLRAALENWEDSYEDLCKLPEEALIKRFWPNGSQPVTTNPEISVNQSTLSVTSSTYGATIGYRPQRDSTATWTIWTPDAGLKTDRSFVFVAHRLGFLPSDVVVYEPEE